MATIGADIAAYLQALGTVGTHTGSPITLFRDVMPASPDVCGAIFESGGAPPTPGFGVEGIVSESPTVQIRFRGVANDSQGPLAKARIAYAALQRVGVTLSSNFYHTLRPMQPPFILERDANQRVVWVFNVAAERDI